MENDLKKSIYNIEQAYEYWKHALINRDLDLLDEICHDRFLWTNSMGITHNKEENLYKVASGNLQYLSWVNEDVSINVVGNVAVLRTREILKMVVYHQKVTAVQDVVILFVKQNEKWLLARRKETNCSY
jgi:hypothetical protein